MTQPSNGAEMEYRFQRVRFPSVTLAHRRMNCIDGAVLFASCAESLGHSPAVVFVQYPSQGHAFLADYAHKGSRLLGFFHPNYRLET
jgi:hypothetical protein